VVLVLLPATVAEAAVAEVVDLAVPEQAEAGILMLLRVVQEEVDRLPAVVAAELQGY
jgi:hypothetical protein